MSPADPLLHHSSSSLKYILRAAVFSAAFAVEVTAFSWFPVYRALFPSSYVSPKHSASEGKHEEQADLGSESAMYNVLAALTKEYSGIRFKETYSEPYRAKLAED